MSIDESHEQYPAHSGSISEHAGRRLAQKVLGMSEGSNPFCVFLPATLPKSAVSTFDEIMRRAKQPTLLEPDMSAPVVASFFDGIGTTPEEIHDFCATQVPPLSLEVFNGIYELMPEDVLSKITHLDSVPGRPICYRFSVVGIPQADI